MYLHTWRCYSHVTLLLAPNCIPAVTATGLPEELSCTPALLNAPAQNKPDTHHWALIQKSTNYWSPTDTTGLNLSCFKSPAGCMGLGDWKWLFKPVTNTPAGVPPHKWSHHLFPSKQPLHRAGRTTASLYLTRVLWKKMLIQTSGLLPFLSFPWEG